MLVKTDVVVFVVHKDLMACKVIAENLDIKDIRERKV